MIGLERLAWSLSVVVALTACTLAAESSSVTSSPSLGPTPTTTPEPAPDLAALGQTYLDAAQPANEAKCAVRPVLDDPNATAEELRGAAGQLADAYRAFADALRATVWPSPVDEDVRALIAALAATESHLRTAQSATTVEDIAANFNAGGESNSQASEAANLVRGDLGLPSVTGDPCAP